MNRPGPEEDPETFGSGTHLQLLHLLLKLDTQRLLVLQPLMELNQLRVLPLEEYRESQTLLFAWLL